MGWIINLFFRLCNLCHFNEDVDVMAANLIREIKKAYPNTTNVEISKVTGYSEATVSRWQYNKTPIPEEVAISLSKNYPLDKIKPNKFECEVGKVDLTEAAQRLGLSKEGMMMCLQQNKFPFGFSYLPRYGKKHNYVIFRGAFERFLKEVR